MSRLKRAVWALLCGCSFGFGEGVPPRADSAESARLVEAQKLLVEASDAHQLKDSAKALGLYGRAYELGATAPTVSYNTACCLARLGRIDDAFDRLERAIGHGWIDVEHLQDDADLSSLHADPRWNDTVRHCVEKRAALRATLGDPDLREELLRRMRIDQEARLKAKPGGLELLRVDADNTAWFKTVVDRVGWPGRSMVGPDGAQAAWLLVQHADRDVPFQRRCLERLTIAYDKGEAAADQVAYLTDRVLVREGKPQVYGTQFQTVGGKLQPFPIEDEAQVDQRRAKMGLGPLAEYAEQMRGNEQQ